MPRLTKAQKAADEAAAAAAEPANILEAKAERVRAKHAKRPNTTSLGLPGHGYLDRAVERAKQLAKA